jgi:simple sugar transport system substrate-binding protein
MPRTFRRTALLALLGTLALPLAAQYASAPLKVAFIYVSPVGQAGWSYQHDLGRQDLETFLGKRVKTTVVESVPEGADAERVMRDLVAQGHQMIIATSYGYLEPALRVAADHPNVKFEHAGGHKTAANLSTYNARFYEGRYLAGLIAGHHSKSGVVGYVAGFPVPEVVQGLNAFALGMRSVNPKAEVKVVWLNTWFDPARERDAALALIGQGVDILTNHTASPAVAQVAEEKKIKLLAYQSDMRDYAPNVQLAAVTQHWGPYYIRAAKALVDGRWQSQAYVGGLQDAMVRLAALSPELGAATREAVVQAGNRLRAGELKPFAGRLLDNTGRERQPAGASMSDEQIARMDWFVEGVTGSAAAKP